MWRLALAILLPLCAWPIRAQNQEPLLDVQLFAHRGFTRDLPENSMAALRAAEALGVTGAEIDLRTTKDGHVVLMHDATVDRTTPGTGAVAAMAFEAVRPLRLEGAGGRATAETVPDLDAVMAFLSSHPRFQVAFDAKDIDVALVGRRVVTAGLQDRVIFFLDDPMDVARARAVKRTDPRLRLSVNLIAWWRIEGLATFVQSALEADALFAHEYWFPKAGFGEAKRTGAQVQVYLPGPDDLPRRLRQVVAMGADVVSTDRPDRIVAMVRPVAAP